MATSARRDRRGPRAVGQGSALSHGQSVSCGLPARGEALRDVIVVGSINVDLVVRASLPGAGETVSGGTFERHFGGKGANQAVAAARLGARATLVGAVGDDDAGRASLANLRAEHVDVAAVPRSPGCRPVSP